MSFKFEWNEFTDQPHNIAPRSERFKHHLKHADTYFSLITSNLRQAIPILSLYRRYWKRIFQKPAKLEGAFALSASPYPQRNGEVIECLKEAGVRKSLVRVPSWEREKLDLYQQFLELLHKQRIEPVIALLQQREDVLFPCRWQSFLEEAFSLFGRICPFFEIGHAWNRTKWGLWDYKEYLKLARPAVSLAERCGVKLVGPAVIDFEFHLYPPILQVIPFDKVSSLLYVDRLGAPENSQFGWTTARKIALLKAVVDLTSSGGRDCWITEVNWPLKETGKYSPASGRPNVSEEEQANYLVRYFIISLASGFIERIYWWQLVAPGYGLIDSRENIWRKRPSFSAFKTMVSLLEGSVFMEKGRTSQAEIFFFSKGGESFAVCWTRGRPFEYNFLRQVRRVLTRDGEEISFQPERIKIEESPKYVFFA